MSDYATINAKLDKILAMLAARPASAPAATGVLASDADLLSEHGDGEIRRNPPRWPGPSFAGQRMSDCSPEFLTEFASFQDWRARKDDEAGAKGETNAKGKPKDGHFARLDGARARGWAAHKRAGTWPSAAQSNKRAGSAVPNDAPADADYDQDVPF